LLEAHGSKRPRNSINHGASRMGVVNTPGIESGSGGTKNARGQGLIGQKVTDLSNGLIPHEGSKGLSKKLWRSNTPRIESGSRAPKAPEGEA
jgi:hypothetical protein